MTSNNTRFRTLQSASSEMSVAEVEDAATVDELVRDGQAEPDKLGYTRALLEQAAVLLLAYERLLD